MSSEAIVGLTNEINSTLLIQQGVGRVRTVYPKEGTVFKPVGSSIIKNSSNNLVAQEFLDWLVSSEGQQQVSKSMLRPVNKSILLENKNFLPINNIKVVEENEQLLYESKEEIISRFEVLLKKYS
jgi:iron(III) transport system substrate-binding protein